MSRLAINLTALRDTAIWVVALSLIIHEAVFHTGPERYGLLTLYATMLGLPLWIRADARRENNHPTTPTPEATNEVPP